MTAPLLEFPTSVIPQSMVATLTTVVGGSGSPFTLEESFQKWAGERWSFDLQMPPILDEDDADEFTSFILGLQGRFGRFLMGDPSRPTPRGIGGGSPLVDGASNIGYQLDFKNAPVLLTNWLKRGDWFQLLSGASSQLHRLTQNINTDSNGRGTLVFTPALRMLPADGATIVINNPRGCFRLDEDSVSWSREPGKITRLGFRAVEAL